MRQQTPYGKSVVHLTPRWILDALGSFDLDPCASDPRPWDCARENYTSRDNGLLLPWHGRVWLNPPYARNEIGLWMGRMALHGWGTALVHARTDTAWFRHIWEEAEVLLFLAGRVVFLTPEGRPQRTSAGTVSDSGAPVVLAAFGQADADSLAFSGLEGQLIVLRMRLVSVAKAETWSQIVKKCLGAMFLARVSRCLYATTKEEATRIGNLTEAIYAEYPRPPAARSLPCIHVPMARASQAFDAWLAR